jgi:hypothetical protein
MKEIEEKIKEQSANLVMVSKKNKKMAMLEQAKKSADEPIQDTTTATATTETKSESEENFEEFTPAEDK